MWVYCRKVKCPINQLIIFSQTGNIVANLEYIIIGVFELSSSVFLIFIIS